MRPSPSISGWGVPSGAHIGQGWLGCRLAQVPVACFPVLLLLPAVHAKEGLAEPHDQAARSAQAPRCKCQAMPRAGASMLTGAGCSRRAAVRVLPWRVSRGSPTPPSPCSVSGPSLLQCPTCAKCFLSRTELQLHEAFKHRGEKLFVCEECGHRASSRNGLQLHIKAKHRWGPSPRLALCRLQAAQAESGPWRPTLLTH